MERAEGRRKAAHDGKALDRSHGHDSESVARLLACSEIISSRNRFP
jgi:hypothetical protein